MHAGSAGWRRHAVINTGHCDASGTWSLIHAISSDAVVKLTRATRADLGELD
jgi:hypothetical protein